MEADLSTVVQQIVRLTSSLMTNSLTVVAKVHVFPNTLIFLLQIVSAVQKLLTFSSIKYQCICHISR